MTGQPGRFVEEKHFTAHDGTRIFYRHWHPAVPAGTGAVTAQRAVVILHRGHEHSGRVGHIVDGLRMPEAAMFAWDARGHGESPGLRGDSPDMGVSINDLDVFVRRITREYGIACENIVVVAQSVGAVIASAWVHDYAPPIRALVLASPAFSVRLYVPFARQGLALMRARRGNFFINSYVKAKLLTHDAERQASYDADTRITRAISVNILLGLYETGERMVDDAAAMRVPTQLFISGSDFVVHKEPQHRFFARLGCAVKEKHVLPGFYHDALGEKGREQAFALIRDFVNRVYELPEKARECCGVDVASVDRWSPSADVHRDLQAPLSLLSPKGLYYRLYPYLLRFVGRFSKGVALGLEAGFDSGSTLDYVYRNQPEGVGRFGRFADRQYLESIGWRGIRIRKRHVEAMLAAAVAGLVEKGQPVRIVDIAAGHGRYVLDAVRNQPAVERILLRDYSDRNVEAGRASIRERGLADKASFEQGDAFNRQSLAAIDPKPTLAVVSGLYELFPENAPLRESLAGLADAVPSGGYLVYTNQPWHPQQEMIARGLTSHMGGKPWVMRCRSQAEMDALVEEAGFRKVDQLADQWGIFSVSLATRT